MEELSAISKSFSSVPLMRQVEKDIEAVDEAAKNADIHELRQLYVKMVETLRDTSNLLDTLVVHYAGKTDTPRYQPQSESAISAMQSVALAGLELAKKAIERE